MIHTRTKSYKNKKCKNNQSGLTGQKRKETRMYHLDHNQLDDPLPFIITYTDHYANFKKQVYI